MIVEKLPEVYSATTEQIEKLPIDFPIEGDIKVTQFNMILNNSSLPVREEGFEVNSKNYIKKILLEGTDKLKDVDIRDLDSFINGEEFCIKKTTTEYIYFKQGDKTLKEIIES